MNLEQDRRRKLDALDALLPVIAGALDVRSVLPKMSEIIQHVIPHDILTLALLTPDRTGVTIHSSTRKGLPEMPEYRFTNPQEADSSNWPFFIARDIKVEGDKVVMRLWTRDPSEVSLMELRPGEDWLKFHREACLRSGMRVSIRFGNQVVGTVGVVTQQPDAYDEGDAEIACRIADHVALALAHERLADELRRTAHAQERAALLEARVDSLVQQLETSTAYRALGKSARWKQVLADATKVADTDTTVLITGESGTGKEVVARFLHRASRRAKGPFIAINCAALPEQLLESELFGYERGAFTSAHVSRTGKIEQASGGVLFLDEVAEMSTAVQAKFLRVLQEREFQRLGGSRTIKADVRVIAATNRDPRVAIQRGTLREDLYYRLSVFEVNLPPLRERREDILVLAGAFLEEIGTTVGRPAAGFSEDARDLLLTHGWPGNVRELRNAIERAVILCEGGLVTEVHLPISISSRSHVADRPALFPPDGVKLATVERDLLSKALAQAHNNKSQAAKLLGVQRGQFYSLLKRHGLTEAKR